MRNGLAGRGHDGTGHRARVGRWVRADVVLDVSAGSPVLPGENGRVTEPFTDLLAGGRPNSLGRTHEVVDLVLANRSRLEELFVALGDRDQLARLRVGDALEKVCREQP